MPDFERDLLAQGGQGGQCRHELRVPVALNYLRGYRRRQQAQLDMSLAERTLQANLASAYAEGKLAFDQLESLRESSTMATESLRLMLLRYQAGESTALEVVDAQNTLTLARNAYGDGLVRYRVALANLQMLTGNL